MSSSRVGLLSILIASCLAGTAAWGASATFQGMHTNVGEQTATFFLRLRAPVPYTPSWTGPRMFTLDVAGASAPGTSQSHSVKSELVNSYRFVDYTGGDGKEHTHWEIAQRTEAYGG